MTFDAKWEAEKVELAFRNDIITGNAPGLTLADLIETAIAAGVEEGRRIERKRAEVRALEAMSVLNLNQLSAHQILKAIRAEAEGMGK